MRPPHGKISDWRELLRVSCRKVPSDGYQLTSLHQNCAVIPRCEGLEGVSICHPFALKPYSPQAREGVEGVEGLPAPYAHARNFRDTPFSRITCLALGERAAIPHHPAQISRMRSTRL